jgi:hypothetical protein
VRLKKEEEKSPSEDALSVEGSLPAVERCTVGLQYVHADRLLVVSDLDEEILVAGMDYPVRAGINWCQRRSTSSSLDKHKLSLLKAEGWTNNGTVKRIGSFKQKSFFF